MFVKIIHRFVILSTLSLLYSFSSAPVVFETTKGRIDFKSVAKLEIIKASSAELVGLLDIDKLNFSFSVSMRSFKGFNSPLQQEHFYEKYIETDIYPTATYKGKIIEEPDLTKNGTYTLRTKGIFTLHGVAQERIIKSDITVKDSKISVRSVFKVYLSEHNIPIPKVVNQKLANEISVEVNAMLLPR